MKLTKITAAACGVLLVAGAADAQRTVNLGHTLSDTSHYSIGADAFAETLAELSDGQFTVGEHPAASRLSVGTVVSSVQVSGRAPGGGSISVVRMAATVTGG